MGGDDWRVETDLTFGNMHKVAFIIRILLNHQNTTKQWSPKPPKTKELQRRLWWLKMLVKNFKRLKSKKIKLIGYRSNFGTQSSSQKRKKGEDTWIRNTFIQINVLRSLIQYEHDFWRSWFSPRFLAKKWTMLIGFFGEDSEPEWRTSVLNYSYMHLKIFVLVDTTVLDLIPFFFFPWENDLFYVNWNVQMSHHRRNH